MTQAAAQNGTSLDEVIASLCRRVTAVETEIVAWQDSAGRVLAKAIHLDRASPACDVSAMDGYALRLRDAAHRTLKVSQEIAAGAEARPLEAGTAARIFTGAMIPPGAELVIPREQLTELAESIRLPTDLEVHAGQHIRRCGENAERGHLLAGTGQIITGPNLGAVASSGHASVRVHRRVRVGVIVTGNEILDVGDTPAAWQLRDGNGPALLGMLSGSRWMQLLAPAHVRDDLAAVAAGISARLQECDALLMTGGVSAGDYDLVPAALAQAGAEILFHKLPIKPGRPILGAVSKTGQPILALPGNPVAVLVTARRFALAALRARGGFAVHQDPPEWVEVAGEQNPPGKLTWFPLAKINGDGKVNILPGRGSGDWVAAAGSDGFVEVPPGETPAGRRRLFRWNA